MEKLNEFEFDIYTISSPTYNPIYHKTFKGIDVYDALTKAIKYCRNKNKHNSCIIYTSVKNKQYDLNQYVNEDKYYNSKDFMEHYLKDICHKN